ncbi:MAG: hypothetical protein JO255_15445 [Alphaproteobacteria bacterium]|nr:hypothetical protein [Alphaproteobacteria bacterium]
MAGPGGRKAPLAVRLGLAAVIVVLGAVLYVATEPKKGGMGAQPPQETAPPSPATRVPTEAEPIGGWQQAPGQRTAAAADVEHENTRQPLAGAPLATGDVVTLWVKAAEPTTAFVQALSLDADGRRHPIYPPPGEAETPVQISPSFEVPFHYAATSSGGTRGFLVLVATGSPPTAAEQEEALRQLPAGKDGGWQGERAGGWVEAHRLDAP